MLRLVLHSVLEPLFSTIPLDGLAGPLDEVGRRARSQSAASRAGEQSQSPLMRRGFCRAQQMGLGGALANSIRTCPVISQVIGLGRSRSHENPPSKACGSAGRSRRPSAFHRRAQNGWSAQIDLRTIRQFVPIDASWQPNSVRRPASINAADRSDVCTTKNREKRVPTPAPSAAGTSKSFGTSSNQCDLLAQHDGGRTI